MNKLWILALVILTSMSADAQSKTKAKKTITKAKTETIKTATIPEVAKKVETPVAVEQKSIQWMSINDALAKTTSTRKKILLDFFTDWCGWCKRMDKTTYEDPKVIEAVNKYYLPVKFNAEREEPVKYQGKEYTMKAQGIRSTHEFAIHILQGKMGYPTTSFLGADHTLLTNIPGYIQADEMALILKFFGENKHLTMQFEEFKKQEQGQ